MSDYGDEKPSRLPHRKKRENESRDYSLSWAVELDGDTIASSSWRSEDFTILSSSYSGTQASVVLSGGQRGAVGEATNTITTSGGMTLEKSLAIRVSHVR